jgi:hypothetical protein
MDGDHPIVEPFFYNGPTPSPAINAPPTIPPISSLVTSIFSSSDILFFISQLLGNPNIHEWHLVQVAFQDSTSLSPSCLQDGRFIVEFYTPHHDDVRFDGSNQHFWLQYHNSGDIATPSSSMATHLIGHSDTLEAHAMQLSLVPFRRWVNLTHTDTYIHGPINFAAVHGRQTCDRIGKANWDAILSHASILQPATQLGSSIVFHPRRPRGPCFILQHLFNSTPTFCCCR